MEKRAINILMLSVLMSLAVLLMPVSVSAETDTAPTVMYKLINHDCIKLKWDEVTGADGYYIYRTDIGTGKTVKCKKLVTDTEFTVKGLEADTDYIFRVAAVSGGKVGNKSSKVKLTTPCEWYYSIDTPHFSAPDSVIIYRNHYDGNGKEIFDSSKLLDKACSFCTTTQEDYWFEIEFLKYDSDNVYISCKYSVDENSEFTIFTMNNNGNNIKYYDSFYGYLKDINIYDKGILYILYHPWSEYEDATDNIRFYNEKADCLLETDVNEHFSSVTSGNNVYYFSYDENEKQNSIKCFDLDTGKDNVYIDLDNQYIYLIFCDDKGKNLYFIKKKTSEKPLMAEYELYKLSLNKEKNTIKKIFTFRIDGYSGYRGHLKDFSYDNGYIYFKNQYIDYQNNTEHNIFYYIKPDGTDLTTQDTPFEWYY